MTPAAFLTRHLSDGAILVTLTRAAGSTPRETGATMAVSATGAAGTIGGGQLEFHCLDIARAMLQSGGTERTLDIPLGPQMGQCCGGRVEVSLRRATSTDLAMQVARERAEAEMRPAVLVFGAGHTGRALVEALAPLPLRVTLIDDRDAVMDGLPAAVTCIRMADPIAAVATAPTGAAHVVLTHSHALDYRLAEAALQRGDASYVGMIGSATKRASFVRWARRHGGGVDTGRLVCPIGAAGRPDKRPEVIAAFAAVEIMAAVNAFAPQTAGVAR
jgi:xanthine dehydrogenase accessory protein XdhC